MCFRRSLSKIILLYFSFADRLNILNHRLFKFNYPKGLSPLLLLGNNQQPQYFPVPVPFYGGFPSYGFGGYPSYGFGGYPSYSYGGCGCGF